jgi:hypothetical protein
MDEERCAAGGESVPPEEQQDPASISTWAARCFVGLVVGALVFPGAGKPALVTMPLVAARIALAEKGATSSAACDIWGQSAIRRS